MAKKQGKSAGITVDLDCLRKAVVVCGGAIGKTGVLRCLRIESFKGSWGVTGSDGQLSVTYQWQGPTHPEWPDLVMLLDAAKLREIVDRVPCDTIDAPRPLGDPPFDTTPGGPATMPPGYRPGGRGTVRPRGSPCCLGRWSTDLLCH